jgi:V8-like Glu-specific endopeptidase
VPSLTPPSTLASPFLSGEILAGRAGQPESPSFEQVMPEPKASPMPATAAVPKIRLLDPGGRPLANFRFTLLQGRTTLTGSLDSNGETPGLGSAALPFDRGQPFRLHIPGMVCTIVRGAMLLVDDPEVEYGGSFFDWKLAGDRDERVREAFWKEYDDVRRLPEGPGALHFLQQDHVVRRPMKMTSNVAIFDAREPSVRLGPLVRYTDDHQARIWLELKSPALVRVVYGKAPSQARLPSRTDAPSATLARHACSVRVGGRHFAMVTLDGLEGDSFVQYRIELGAQPAGGALPQHESEFTDAVFTRRVAPDTALSAVAFEGSPWFFLRTMARQGGTLRFAHGSCRKWPNDSGPKGESPGPDMLEAFGEHWLAKLKEPANWPRFFIHTGDQIYADDIGRSLATTLIRQRRSAVLPGPAPKGALDVAFGAWAGRFGWRYAARDPQLPAAELADLQRLRPRIAERSQDDHDLEGAIARARRAAEHQAAYDTAIAGAPAHPMGAKLRVLNRLLWEVPVAAADVPRIDKLRGLLAANDYRVAGPPAREFKIAYPAAGETLGVHAADFAEYAACYEQAWATPAARRALAHVPSYMIFDDHEVADDWNADAEWTAILHSPRDPLATWPMTVTDALAAYWVYQGWGNLAPQQSAADARGQLLAEAARTGRDALPALRRLIHQRAVMPMAPKHEHGNRLAWNFSIPAAGAPFLVADLRTDREVHGDGRISPTRWAWIRRELTSTRSAVAYLVLPVPFLMPDPMLFAFRHAGFTGKLAGARSTAAFRRDSDLEHPAGNPIWDQLKGLLAELQKSGATLKTIVLISGDVHFSCNLDGQLPGAKGGPRLLQLISSGLRQRISDSKQGKMASAYRGWLNTISGDEGVDKHRGIVMTLGGLQGPGGATDNFIYQPSFAVVQTRTVPFGPAGRTVAVPLVEQQHFVADAASGVVPWSMRHMTQGDGSAVMSLHDPGFRHPARPTAYPKASGVGVAREEEDLLDEAVGEGPGLPAAEADESVPAEAIMLDADGEALPFEECLGIEEADDAHEVVLASEEERDDKGGRDAFESEVFGNDGRVRVTDTLIAPARWICAIDLFIDDPKRGKGGSPVKSLSRATGILIGPRHVLTAAHVFDGATVEVDGVERKVPVTSVRVTPARNGDNDKGPFGSATSKTFRRPASFAETNDYALIVLDSDLSQATNSKVPLGYWGQSAGAALRVLDPATLVGASCTVIGYPGDRCGDKPIDHVEEKIRNCAQQRAGIWASTAWRSTGAVRLRPGIAIVLHEADTWEGQSGAPLFLDRNGTIDLLAVHGGAFQPDANPPTSNRAARVTTQMLSDLRDWSNAVAGRTVAEVRNGALVFTGGAATSREQEWDDEAWTQGESEVGTQAEEENGKSSRPSPAEVAKLVDTGLRTAAVALPQVPSTGRRQLLEFAVSILQTHFFPNGHGVIDGAGRVTRPSARARIEMVIEKPDGSRWPFMHRVQLSISARPARSGRWAGEHGGAFFSVITLFSDQFAGVSAAAAAGAAVHEVVHMMFSLQRRLRARDGDAVADRFIAVQPWRQLDLRPFAAQREALLAPLAELVRLLALPATPAQFADSLVEEAFCYMIGETLRRAIDATGRPGPRVMIDSVSMTGVLVRNYVVERSELPGSALSTPAVAAAMKRLAPAVEALSEAMRAAGTAPVPAREDFVEPA